MKKVKMIILNKKLLWYRYCKVSFRFFIIEICFCFIICGFVIYSILKWYLISNVDNRKVSVLINLIII